MRSAAYDENCPGCPGPGFGHQHRVMSAEQYAALNTGTVRLTAGKLHHVNPAHDGGRPAGPRTWPIVAAGVAVIVVIGLCGVCAARALSAPAAPASTPTTYAPPSWPR